MPSVLDGILSFWLSIIVSNNATISDLWTHFFAFLGKNIFSLFAQKTFHFRWINRLVRKFREALVQISLFHELIANVSRILNVGTFLPLFSIHIVISVDAKIMDEAYTGVKAKAKPNCSRFQASNVQSFPQIAFISSLFGQRPFVIGSLVPLFPTRNLRLPPGVICNVVGIEGFNTFSDEFWSTIACLNGA